ncbi:serine hydrolase [Metabacillus indicus]|uniref:serine hydrolase n=1 Tax=Metabacillus indicus TaxID=246786 RepID=UPI0029FFE97E|nr:serine hydrolase [Metabacillus indicus]MDX8290954.1 serine hydrolase [Metabacillus indicus]
MNDFVKNAAGILSNCSGRAGACFSWNGEWLEAGSCDVFSSASLIKLPILLTAFRLAEKGNLDLNEKVKLRDVEKTGGAGVLQALSEDAVLSVQDLLTLMITVSDNAATNWVIEKIGMPKINETIEGLGLFITKLNRKMMDLDAIQSGIDNFTSPADMVRCLQAINEGDFISEDSRLKILDILQKQQFTDKLPYSMDKDLIYAGNKTGELPGIEHDCAIIKYRDTTVYAAVMIDQLEQKEWGRKTISEVGKLIYEKLLDGKG